MTILKQIYKCEICGNMVEVLDTGVGELVCCGQPMLLQNENVRDLGFEKHVPVFEKKEGGILVKVGEQPHPMEEDHFIEWIEVLFENGRSYQELLNFDADSAEIFVPLDENPKEIRAYCNVHGLWVNKLS